MNDLWDKLDPGFFEPVWLFVGLLAVIAIVLLEIGAFRRRRQALRLFAAPHLVGVLTASVSLTKRFWKRALLTAGVTFLFAALARPHLFYQWQEENRAGIDLLLAVDCSKSMMTQDVKPSRLERAKLAISDFADRLPDDRLGLIAFAGDAFLQVPLTLDHEAFQTAVQELDTDTIPRPGTDIAVAIDEAVLAFRSQAANQKILILVTDGEDLEGRVLTAAQNAAKAGLKIYTVGVGTAQGGLIPQLDDSGATMYLHDSSGAIVQSRLDEKTLKEIASDTGGAYLPLGQRGEGLDQLYHRYIEPLPKARQESKRDKVRFEQYQWPLSLSIVLLIWSFLLSERSGGAKDTFESPPPLRQRRKIATALAGLVVLVAFPLQAATTDKAEREYKAGQYPEAEQNYQEALSHQPARDELKYNLGDAAYKAGEFSQAEDDFHHALATPDLALQEKAYYNLGNAQFRHGEAAQKDDQKKTISLWEQALKSYTSSMKLKTSADTQHNYEYVKTKLEQLKQQQKQEQQQQQQKKDSSGKPQKDDGGQGDQQQSQSQQGQKPQDENQDQAGKDPQPKKSPDQASSGQEPQQQQPSPGNADKQLTQGHSTSRQQDQVDPGAKSRQDAEDLLDSLKDDEKHLTARTLNGNNEPPPPPSGKDW